ncbi:MAG: sugar ABC transporter permease [Clostridia bacterium]|nr:sugar ABC transporter permease [Clostridia bacterium]
MNTAVRSRPNRIYRLMKKALGMWQLYVLLLPAVIYLILFNYIPMYGVQIAFRDFRASKGILGSKWVGLKYFIKFVTYPNFWKIIRNTVTLSAYSLALFPLALILAMMLNEVGSLRFKKFAQMVTYAPHFISTVVLCSMVTLFFGRANGLINNLRELIGYERVAYMESPTAFKHIYVWSGKWQNTGWNTIIYMSALAGVSMELIEAARIDGANRLQIIWHVNLPAILPTVVILLIMSCGSLLSVGFEKVYLLQNSLNLDSSQVISTYVYDIGLQNGQYSYSAAIGLFNTVINIIFVMTVNAISKKVTDVGLW